MDGDTLGPLSLPNDILLLIFEHLDESCYTSVSVVSTHWHHVAEFPLLWRCWAGETCGILQDVNYYKSIVKRRIFNAVKPVFHVVIVGSPKVGKTTLLRQIALGVKPEQEENAYSRTIFDSYVKKFYNFV